jgi:uncharacterized integral membrane protein (TIGR00697 family)
MALYVFGVMVAELMGAKTFPLVNFSWLHLSATVSIFVLPLLFTMTDVVVEVYGRKRARSMVFSGLLVVALLMLYSLLATSLPPSARFASQEPAYDAIFHSTIQIAFASIVAFAASEFMDVLIFARIREKLGSKALWFRNNASNFVSQFFDSAVFIILAFYSFTQPIGSNMSFLFGLIIPYWLLRCVLSLVETPLVYLGVWWLKRGKEEES